MKTNLSTRSLKRWTITAVAAVLLNIGLSAQPVPEGYDARLNNTAELDEFIRISDQSLKYIAPDCINNEQEDMYAIQEEVDQAFQSLDQFSANIEAGLKYSAPDASEEEAIQNLELLTTTFINELKYKATSSDQHLLTEADAPIKSLERQTRPVKVEVYRTPKDAWLLDAGYFKSERTPAFTRVKRLMGARQAARHYAIED